jgi:hypothetical protein
MERKIEQNKKGNKRLTMKKVSKATVILPFSKVKILEPVKLLTNIN